MIILDTHIWVWWVHGDERLNQSQMDIITANEADIIGVSVISCWEIAKLVQYGRLGLPCSISEWFGQALEYPGIQLLALTPEIAIESTRLPGKFHRDPADQIIVATARLYKCPLMTLDDKIMKYPHVKTVES
ncbi:TPA: type II toxin-antitoxin system VapC family toxin [bacterium]|nr:type II toxin-antitoxin system VapC family toxin [bacterium]